MQAGPPFFNTYHGEETMRTPEEIRRKKALLEEAIGSAHDLAIKAQYSAMALSLEWALNTEEGDKLDVLTGLLDSILFERKAMCN
jgi:hypothetical protein